MITILATCAGGHGKQNLFDSLYNNPDNEDVKLVTCDIKNHELLKHQTDKFYTIPKSNDINFIPKLLEICKIENIDVIISSNEDECHIIAKNIELFHKIGTYPCVNNIQSYLDTDHKHKTFKDLESLIDVPLYHIAHNIQEFKEFSIQQKTCFKPSRRSETGNARGFRIIDDSVTTFESIMKQEYNDIINLHNTELFFQENKDNEPILLMEFLPNSKYTVSAFSDNGKLKSISINKINDTELELATDCSLNITHKKIREYCEKIVDLYKLDYCSIIEFKDDFMNNPKFMEINPRVGSSTALTWKIGLNHPWLMVLKALGKNYDKHLTNPHGRVFRYWNEKSI